MTDNLIICENLGLMKPTVVYHKGERLETKELNIETLVKTWRDKWFDLKWEWIVLALSEKEYNAICQRTLPSVKSVRELLYEQQVICINQQLIKDFGNDLEKRIKALENYNEQQRQEQIKKLESQNNMLEAQLKNMGMPSFEEWLRAQK